MDAFDDFKRDLEENKKEVNRADFFKLKNGDNKVVILTNPVGYSEVYGIGIAYEGCGYGKYAGRRYKVYVKDLEDNKIKIANFSYTVAKDLFALSEGARTAFKEFPIPYIINFKTEKAGTKEVETKVLADADYELSEEDKAELAQYDSVRDIIDRLKASQEKKIQNDPALQQKVSDFIAKKEQEEADRKSKKEKDSAMKKVEEFDTIEYPEDEINLEDIPF